MRRWLWRTAAGRALVGRAPPLRPQLTGSSGTLGRRLLHTTEPCGYNWRWPAEVGGGWDEQPDISDDLPLKLRSFKREGRITPRKKLGGKRRFTAKGHEKGVGGMAVGLLKSDAWMLQKTATFHQQGAQALREQRFSDARGFFEQSIELHGNHSKTYLLWARMEQKLGNSQRARQLLQDGLGKSSDNPYLLQAFGVLEWQSENFDEARARFQQALEAKPRDAVAYQSWGMLEHELGNLDASELVFRKGWSRAPKKQCSGLLHAWGLLEQERGALGKARMLFLKSIQAEVRHGYAYCAWGNLEKQDGNIDRARELFLRGVRADPCSAHLLHAWAHLEITQGETERARELLRQCLVVSPNNIKALDVWRVLERNDGNEEEAAKLADRKANAKAHSKRRREQAKRGGGVQGPEEDLVATTDERQQNDSSGDSLMVRAIAMGEARNIGTSRRLFSEAIAGADGEQAATVAATLAWCRMELRYKYPDRARHILHAALDEWPDDSSLLEQLGRVEAADKQVEEARRLFQAATIASPERISSYRAWGRLERKTNNVERARELLGRALGLASDDFNTLVECAVLERSAQNWAAARTFAQRAVAQGTGAELSIPLQILGTVEKAAGRYSAARDAFRGAVQENARCAASLREWAVLELETSTHLSAASLAKFEEAAALRAEIAEEYDAEEAADDPEVIQLDADAQRMKAKAAQAKVAAQGLLERTALANKVHAWRSVASDTDPGRIVVKKRPVVKRSTLG